VPAMADTWNLVVRRLDERRSELVHVLAAARESAEHLAVEAEAVSRHTSGRRGVERMLIEAVRARDAVDEVLHELQRSPGAQAEADELRPPHREGSSTSARRGLRVVVRNPVRTSPPA
jgi:hypothetical protein